jgi:hypothetical protein
MALQCASLCVWGVAIRSIIQRFIDLLAGLQLAGEVISNHTYVYGEEDGGVCVCVCVNMVD